MSNIFEKRIFNNFCEFVDFKKIYEGFLRIFLMEPCVDLRDIFAELLKKKYVDFKEYVFKNF